MTTLVNIGGAYRNVEIDTMVGSTVKHSYYRYKETFEDKIKKFLNPCFFNVFCKVNNIESGTLIQLQNPAEKGVYGVDCTMKNERTGQYEYECDAHAKLGCIEDLLVSYGDENGCFNFVASLDEAKIGGQYRSRSRRVLSSRTYVVIYEKDLPLAVELLDNFNWLSVKASKGAFAEWVRVTGWTETGKKLSSEKLKMLSDSMTLNEVSLSLGRSSFILKAARVVAMPGRDGVCYFIISMNSGKIWFLDESKVTIIKDITVAESIMTNYVKLKKQGAGDYILMK